MAVVVPKQPKWVIPEKHRKNSFGTMAPTQSKDGNDKKVIMDYKESDMYLSRKYRCISSAHSKNISGKGSACHHP